MSVKNKASFSDEKTEFGDSASIESQIQYLLDTNTQSDIFLVCLPRDDPNYSQNWSTSYKIFVTLGYSLASFCTQVNSAIMLPIADRLEEEFQVHHIVAVLSASIFVLGIAFGPIFFGPFTEVYGRKLGTLFPFGVSILFTIFTGLSTRIANILITRFVAGFFGSATMISSGGVVADIWEPSVRGTTLVFYSLVAILGPNMGSIIGSVINVNLSWRWVNWTTVIASSIILIIDVLAIQESCVSVLDSKYAQDVRIKRNNRLYHSKIENSSFDFYSFIKFHFGRPIKMMCIPIVFFMTTFSSFTYGVFYLLLTCISTTFKEVRGWPEVSSSLCCLAIFIGSVIGGIFSILGGIRYRKLLKKTKKSVLPEERLYPMMMGGCTIPVGILIFFWTQTEEIHWIISLSGLTIFGCGTFIIVQGCLNYLIDSFQHYSASVTSSSILTRSIFSGIFPLFGYQLFSNIGLRIGGTVLAGISICMLPIPFIFYKYGQRIRESSPYINA